MTAESRPAVWTRTSAARDALRDRAAWALVPTMGDLHEGHLDLVRAAASVGPVVVSVFVNPTQFAPGEDYDRYPRRLEADVERLAALGVIGVFAPTVDELYPTGESTRVDVGAVARPLCGAHRAGHFEGVATVCTKLFAGLRPPVAAFGEKDAQQCLVLHRLVEDLRFGIDLLFVPTRREDDGLAMSSRNRYLEGDQRTTARALSAALEHGGRRLTAGERDVGVIEAAVRGVMIDAGVDVDYAEMRRVPSLAHEARAEGRVLLAVAGHVGRARLIDNRCFDVRDDAVASAPLMDAHTPEAVAARWADRTT